MTSSRLWGVSEGTRGTPKKNMKLIRLFVMLKVHGKYCQIINLRFYCMPDWNLIFPWLRKQCFIRMWLLITDHMNFFGPTQNWQPASKRWQEPEEPTERVRWQFQHGEATQPMLSGFRASMWYSYSNFCYSTDENRCTTTFFGNKNQNFWHIKIPQPTFQE